MGRFRDAFEADLPAEQRPRYSYGPPVTEKDLRAAEAALGLPIPAPLRALYLEFDGLWEGALRPRVRGNDFDAVIVIPVRFLLEARNHLDACYREDVEGWSADLRRCVVFGLNDGVASFLFLTDQVLWGVQPGHVGKWDHDGDAADLWPSLEDYLGWRGRPWQPPG
jgi:hypothetical protein